MRRCNMKSIIVAFLLLVTGVHAGFAQQDAMYTQYMFNALAINPAYAGNREVWGLTALMRKQWTGIEGAPSTQTLSLDGPVGETNVGLGLQAFNDQIGVSQTTGAFISAAYRIPTNEGSLAFGMQAGLAQYHADFSSVDLGNNGLPDAAFSSNVNELLPNLGAGLSYNSDRFYAGISMPHILNNSLSAAAADEASSAKQFRHIYLTSGYVFDLANDFKLKPSVLLKAVSGAPLAVDVNANFWIKERFAIGAQYRLHDAYAALLITQITDKLRLGYSYDKTISELSSFNSGSHEIVLRYEFGRARNNRSFTPQCYKF